MSDTEAGKLEHPLLLPPVHRQEDLVKYRYSGVPVAPEYEREGAEDFQPGKHGSRIPSPFSCHIQDPQEQGPPRSSTQQQTRDEEEEHPTLDSARSVSPPVSTVPVGPTRPTPLNTMSPKVKLQFYHRALYWWTFEKANGAMVDKELRSSLSMIVE
ncbi:hypothetical protein PHLCEN_2v12378 [Hermanssonia centrifuga]|uniref:Uncharacterized protein n=1 Tax=Hermanssonia centrifuga TaxID=98765 RepID=A0A2R6NH89_9APHY|nr:hypothetical protein PHLCEN_2v12378 [Hermanssonia centrifuga]